MLVLKKLRDPLDGDNYSQIRNLPASMWRVTEKDVRMPVISWNSKITRVYKIEHLKSIKWNNL